MHALHPSRPLTLDGNWGCCCRWHTLQLPTDLGGRWIQGVPRHELGLTGGELTVAQGPARPRGTSTIGAPGRPREALPPPQRLLKSVEKEF